MLKDTVWWVFGVGVTMLFNASEASKDSSFFRKAIIDTLKVTVVLEYVVNFFVFSFITEAIIFPVLVMAIGIKVMAEHDSHYARLKGMVNSILGIYGLSLLGYSVYEGVHKSSELLTLLSLRSIALPCLLTICYCPFIYFFALYLEYDRLFHRLAFINDKPEVLKAAKNALLKRFHINMPSLIKWASQGRLLKFKNIEDASILKLEDNDAA